jgi:hypothetical protein
VMYKLHTCINFAHVYAAFSTYLCFPLLIFLPVISFTEKMQRGPLNFFSLLKLSEDSRCDSE